MTRTHEGTRIRPLSAFGLAVMLVLPAAGCSKDNAVDASQNTTECGDDSLECVPCEAGEYKCDGAVLKVCQADGQGFDAVMSCVTEALCVKGLPENACAAPECNSADTKCDGAIMIICAEGRDNLEETVCPSEASCIAGLKDGKCAAGECSVASECTGVDTECRKRTCLTGACGTQDLPEGTPCETNRQCDGAGQCVGECNVAADCAGQDTECRKRTCAAGVCGTLDQPEGTLCETNRQCDGAGQCVGECNVAADCTGQDTECRKRTCLAGVCGTQDSAPGTILTSQVEGDCKQRVCDSVGGVTTEALATDEPNDGNDCTVNTCEGSTPKATWAAEGTVCNTTGVCDQTGSCVACVAGNTACNGNELKTCQSNGQWDMGAPCTDSACVTDSCVGVCVPGTERCSGQVPQTCDANGAWQGTAECPSSACVNGECAGACAPGSTKCDGNSVLTCSSLGDWPATGVACVDQACVGGVCVGTCEPAAVGCDGLLPQTCDENGSWQPSAPACVDQACVDGSCVGTCSPGSTLCSGNQVVTCSSTGEWPATGAACLNQACVGGVCVGSCAPGTTRCSGWDVQTCDSNGEWQSTHSCSAPTPVCSGGACVPIPSCVGLASNCGPTSNESCCASALVPAGSFLMGRSESGTDQYSPAFDHELPEHNVTVSAFKLDVYEVTVGRFRKFVDTYQTKPLAGAGANPNVVGSGWNTAWNSWMPGSQALKSALKNDPPYYTWRDSPADTEHLPINNVNWTVAFAFCAWDGGWLPTEAEWEMAAAGGDENRLYPWGADAPSMSIANYGCYGDGVSGVPCAFSDILAPGSRPAGQGRWGHHDLAGSMNEWVFDEYSATWYSDGGSSCVDCANLPTGEMRVVRGGGFWDWERELRAASRVEDDMVNARVTIGIRCARPAL